MVSKLHFKNWFVFKIILKLDLYLSLQLSGFFKNENLAFIKKILNTDKVPMKCSGTRKGGFV